jgi:hypothetical protein
MTEVKDPWEGLASLNTHLRAQWELVDHVSHAAQLPVTAIRVRPPEGPPLLLALPTPFRIYAQLGESKTLDDLDVPRLWRRYAASDSRSTHSLVARARRFHDQPRPSDYLNALVASADAGLPPGFITNVRVLNHEKGIIAWDMHNFHAARRVIDMLKLDGQFDRAIETLMDPGNPARPFERERSTDVYLWVQLPELVERARKRGSVLSLMGRVPAPLASGETMVLAVDTVIAVVLEDPHLQEQIDSRKGYSLGTDLCTVHTPALRVATILNSELERQAAPTKDMTHGVEPPLADMLAPVPGAWLQKSTERKRRTVDEIMSDRPAKSARQGFLSFTAQRKKPPQ